MEENIKLYIKKLVKKAVDETAVEELKKMPNKIKKQQNEDKLAKSQKQEQVDTDLFYGGDRNYKFDTKLNLKENEIIKVSSGELDNFKNDFIAHLQGHTVEFDNKVINGKNSIADFPYKDGTTDAIITGRIDKDITFKMSLKDGLRVNFNEIKIDSDNKSLLDKLYNLYETLFKEKFTSIINPSEQ